MMVSLAKQAAQCLLMISLVVSYTNSLSGQGSSEDYERASRLRELARGKVVGIDFDVSWIDDGNSLWFVRSTGDGGRQYMLANTSSGKLGPAFDHEAVAEFLSSQDEKSYASNRLVLVGLELGDDDRRRLRLRLENDEIELSVVGDKVELVEDNDQEESKTLEALAPDRRRRSGESRIDSYITFVNKTSKQIRTYWIDAQGEPREYESVAAGESRRQHSFASHVWLITTMDEEPLAMFVVGNQPSDAIIDGPVGTPENRRRGGRRMTSRGSSPDGRYRIEIQQNNAVIVDSETGEKEVLSEDGSPEDSYQSRAYWSPDSKRVAILQTIPSEEHIVHYIESSPNDQVQPKLRSYSYLKPGDRIANTRPKLFDIEARKPIELDESLFDNPWRINNIQWTEDSKQLIFLYNQRGHQVMRVISVNAESGETRAVIDDQPETFFDYSNKTHFSFLEESNEFIWMSERSGWNHLYLIDASTGETKNAITSGQWVVRGVERVDEENRQIWIRLMGYYSDQDPYHVHFARVDFDGSNLTLLTDGDGTHNIEYSPNQQYYVDEYSRVDLPPVRELRKTSDGSLVCKLHEADWTSLVDAGWIPPERFVAKARDGETDIWGLIYRPTNFDSSKTYPVIESIYAGPHGHHVPKGFRSSYSQQSLAELGFIVVQIDGMGTNWRSKRFHDFCWKNIADAGFEDRKLWIRAAAEQYPFMDIERVGIYGGSAGGQNAMRALIDHHDLYDVAVADCGCHDNRMDKIWWNEAWMGWPVDESYSKSSNVDHAHRMDGKLLLTVGEVDSNVDPASTMQVVDALIKANKDFDLIVFPGRGHGAGGSSYGTRRRNDFFVRHLLGVEPRWTD